MKLIGFIGLVGLVSLVSSCSKDDGFDELQNADGVAIGGVNGYTTYFAEEMLLPRGTRSNETNRTSNSYVGLTRAWDIPTGYVAYEGGYQPIAFSLTQDGISEEKKKELMDNFFMSSGTWRTYKEMPSKDTYYLYGYIPHLVGIKFGITDHDGGETDEDKNAEYSKGAIITLQDVPSVMSGDLCVIIGAKDGTDKEHDNGLRAGNFQYTTLNGSDKKDYVFLLFDHLYAALQVTMSVDPDYAKLRKIKLKSLQLSTKAKETATKKKTNITVKLAATDVGSPITSIDYDQTGDDMTEGLAFWPPSSSSSSGTVLGTTPQTFIGHFLPQNVTTLILTSTYDVYDMDDNLIRKGCQATNTMVLGELLSEEFEATRCGMKYEITMTIQPTYLYMLSDPDLDNPTVTVN